MKRMIYAGSLSLFLFSCGEANHKDTANAEFLNSEAPVPLSDSLDALGANPITFQDSRTDLVKQANLKLEVDNVSRAVDELENKTMSLGGFIQQSNQRSNVLSEEEFPYSSDSSTRVRTIQSSANLHLRIPSEHLAVFLHGLDSLKLKVVERSLEANSVSLDLLEARLEQQRLESYNGQLIKTVQPKQLTKAGDAIQTQEVLMERTRLADWYRLEQLRIQDKIRYADLHIDVLQPEFIEHVKIANIAFRESPKMPLVNELKAAFLDGLTWIEKLAIVLVRMWSLLVLFLIGFWAYKKWKPLSGIRS